MFRNSNFDWPPEHKKYMGISGVCALLGGIIALIGNDGFGQIRHDNLCTRIGSVMFVGGWLVFMVLALDAIAHHDWRS
jgi:hypothetical protein